MDGTGRSGRNCWPEGEERRGRRSQEEFEVVIWVICGGDINLTAGLKEAVSLDSVGSRGNPMETEYD